MGQPDKIPDSGGLRQIFQDIRQAFRFDTEQGVTQQLSEFTRFQRLVVRNLRIFMLMARLDVIKQLKLHAQALTFDTMLALVPMLAVIFSVIKGLGGFDGTGEKIEELIVSNLAGTTEIREAISGPLQGFIENIHAGHVGAISIAVLIWSVLSLLGHIETAFNRIFGTTSNRPLVVRLLTYWAILTLGPVLLAASFALTAAFQSAAFEQLVDSFGLATSIFVNILPLVVTWVALTVMYVAVPNTRVRLPAAFGAAVISGTLWNIAKFGYAIYAKNAFTLHNIYGSLAVIPLFILWLYISWLLVLFGAQLAYAFQNSQIYRYEDPNRIDSQSTLELAICRLFLEIGRDFFHGEPPTDPKQAAVSLQMPRNLLERSREILREGGFIIETDEHTGLVPSRDLADITVEQILDAVRSGQGTQPLLAPDHGRAMVTDILERLSASRAEIAGSTTFRELVSQLPAPNNSAEDTEV